MTNNQQMLDVLDKLMKKGWKFEEIDITVIVKIIKIRENLTHKKESFKIDGKHYRIPTILEAEAVIIKMATYITICLNIEAGGYYQYNIGQDKIYSTHWDKYTELKRLLAALQLALKLAEAEPDKFKLIFEEK